MIEELLQKVFEEKREVLERLAAYDRGEILIDIAAVAKEIGDILVA